MKLKHTIGPILAAVFVLSSAALAFADPKPFTQEKFDDLLADNKPVLIDIAADWCPTCKRQATILTPMLEEEGFEQITSLRVDFDTQKDVVKNLEATRQSTLILFKDGVEIDRGIAETNPDRLRAFVSQLK